MFDFYKKKRILRGIEKTEEQIEVEFQRQISDGMMFANTEEYEFLKAYVDARISVYFDKLRVLCPFKDAGEVKAVQAKIDVLDQMISDIKAIKDFVEFQQDEERVEVGVEV